jgi:predicted NBD/HSP70 family sugar kinase
LHLSVRTLARYAHRSLTNGNNGPTFERLVDLAFEGDQIAVDALIETAHYLGLGISNVSKGLSPQAVILGGQKSLAPGR